jgi:AcrR family transcriptional regulator
MATAQATGRLLAPDEDRRAKQPRRPLQKRSRERFKALLDATDALLEVSDVSEVGLYGIAEQANVPPGSVYHFFPTKEAAFVALAERYLEQLYRLTRLAPPDLDQIRNWPDLFRVGSLKVMDFYNSNPVMLKLFFGSAISPEIRHRDAVYVEALSASGYDWMNTFFEMPYIPDAERKFSVVWSIFDGVTKTSYERHGKMTMEFHREQMEAIIGYCRTFLPEVIPLRSPETRTTAPGLAEQAR